VVLLARVYALRVGSDALSTRDRLHAAGTAGLLSVGQAEDLVDALEVMTYRRLHHQVEQARQGLRPDNHLDPTTLSDRERHHLKDAFGIVRRVQGQLESWLGPGYR
jgi:CBS domain-containing protein